MRLTLALVALSMAASTSAWIVTTGFWESSETDYCIPADLSQGEEVTVGDLPDSQRVFFFADDKCKDFEFSITEAGTTELQADIGSFQVLEFEDGDDEDDDDVDEDDEDEDDVDEDDEDEDDEDEDDEDEDDEDEDDEDEDEDETDIAGL
ncbi:hypothetical protein BJY01DRAFT_250529 [Aspergillus pseudoustus]|uniref:Uncharacterized protein n=1 Tax=Aspergillus pseudoustus TaxID=1810923 RepID=A0ABR4JH29_9EURO